MSVFLSVSLHQKLERTEERLFYMENKHSYLQQEVARVKDMEGQVGKWDCREGGGLVMNIRKCSLGLTG